MQTKELVEIHFALWLPNLKYFDEIPADRKEKYRFDIEILSQSPQLSFQDNQLREINF